MTRRCEASGAGMAASRPLPQSAGFASNVSRDVGVEGWNHRKVSLMHHLSTLILGYVAAPEALFMLICAGIFLDTLS